MDKPPESQDLARVEPEEYARLRAGQAVLEREAQADREAQAKRDMLEAAWREQEAYSRAVAELKDEEERRFSPRLLLLAAIAAVLGAVVAGMFFYDRGPSPEQLSEADALRIASQARLRREEEARVRLAAEAQKAAESSAETVNDATPAEEAAAKLRAEEEAKRAAAMAAEKAAEEARNRTLALKAKEEERRKAELAAQAQAKAMAQAEERARAVAAAQPREAPRVVAKPGTVFQDCADCPRMVVLPAGEFMMGSPAGEAGRSQDEGPQRQVSIAQPFALGRSEVTVAEFRRFVEEAGYRTEAERDARSQGCSGFIYADPAAATPATPYTSWRAPGLAQAQADSHPVLCVSWNDARAYAQWLSKVTGKRYRLPTEAEWEYAARAGSASARFWGDEPDQGCRYANVADQSRFQTWSFGQKHECTDGHYFTAPAGGYAPNRFGLYDMLGNVWEWTDDCWNASYAGAPSDGTAWLRGDCSQRVLRGGSWSTVPRFARSAARFKNASDYRDNLTGFRLARTME